MIPHDKSLHALAGAAIFSAAYVVMYFQRLPALEIAAWLVLLAGVGKEAHDWWRNKTAGKTHGVELADALWTVAGGAIPALPIIAERLGR